MIYVYSSRPSRSARALARALRGRRIRGGEIEHDALVINWGDSTCRYPKVLNSPESIRIASNKKLAFEKLKAAGVSVPKFATTKDAVSWQGVAATVVRHKLASSSGEGIEIVDEGELPNAPLYVEYIKKENEYRVHVIGKEIVLIQRKARRLDTPKSEVNWRIRNHDNGFVFVRQDIRTSSSIRESAIDTVRTLGLDFGAVDIIEQKNGKSYVLEVNTAPGMEGSTSNDYANGFREFLRPDRNVSVG